MELVDLFENFSKKPWLYHLRQLVSCSIPVYSTFFGFWPHLIRTFEYKKNPNVILWKSLYKRKVGVFLHDFYKKLLASTNAFLDRAAAKKIYIRVIQKVEKNWRSIVRSRPFIADTDHWSSCDLWVRKLSMNDFWLLGNQKVI